MVCAWGWLKVSVSWVGFVIPGRFIKLVIHGVCVALVWREFSVGAICCLRLVCGLARSPLSFRLVRIAWC